MLTLWKDGSVSCETIAALKAKKRSSAIIKTINKATGKESTKMMDFNQANWASVTTIRKNTFALELLRTTQNVVSTQEHLQTPRSSWVLVGAPGKLSDIPQHVDVPMCSYVTPRKS